MKKKIPTLVALLLLAVLVLTGVKEFSPWPQITDLWQQQATALSLIGHPHLYRYLLTYPGMVLENAYPRVGFSLYCSLFLVVDAFLFSAIVRKVHLVSPSLMAWAIFFMAHMFMNGRGVMAWSGWLLCVSLCIDLSRVAMPVRWPVLRGAIACFLGAVSTGVFIVVMFSIFIFLIQRWRAGRGRLGKLKELPVLLMLVPCTCVFASYFILAVEKNLDFYGAGVQGAFRMLEHGMGYVFLVDGGLGDGLAVIAVCAGGAIAVRLFSGPQMCAVRKLLIIALMGGFFGFTVLTLAIPLMLCEAHHAKQWLLRFARARNVKPPPASASPTGSVSRSSNRLHED